MTEAPSIGGDPQLFARLAIAETNAMIIGEDAELEVGICAHAGSTTRWTNTCGPTPLWATS